ncbi:MAG: DUF4159 domain-containing protein [Planctomycetaceae bacterium]
MHALKRASCWTLLAMLATIVCSPRMLFAQQAAGQITAKEVLQAIERGRDYLLGQQRRDGSWDSMYARYPLGTTALVTLALLNTGLTPRDPDVARALDHLRSRANDSETTYEVSLLCSVFAAARDGQTDRVRLGLLVRKLESGQIRRGDAKGAWGYETTKSDGLWHDRSNTQFALLGLRDAAVAGVPVNRETWEAAREHWQRAQSNDGGWGYSGLGGRSIGSMTVAGIASLTIIKSMLVDDAQDITPDGKPVCCGDDEADEHLARGLAWLEKNFSVGSNPNYSNWPLYYLYGLERAGRLSGKRFFGQHDWYREGAEFLVRRARNPANGTWEEGDRLIGTSYALLFLSKGLSPVLISKLQYPGPNEAAADSWNAQPDDVRNLTEHITALPKWPHLMSTQTVDLSKLPVEGGADVLLQSKILYISGTAAPIVTDAQVKVLREYLDAGGYILAAATCQEQAADFDRGFRRLIARIYDGEQAELKLLPATHAVYRSEYPLERGDETIGLWGVDFGCRSPIIYVPPQAPLDLACLWSKWTYHDPPGRDARLVAMIRKAMWAGVNIVAYATGREPPVKLQDPRPDRGEGEAAIERGLLQVARVRHGGGWDTAPRALSNLLKALNEAVGLAASTNAKNVAFADRDLYKYPVVYMHGRNSFQLSPEDREQLKKYAERGGVLFADACCGARPFDESFRAEIEAAFGAKLERIPADHELFSERIGYSLRTVKRRSAAAANPDEPIDTTVSDVEPFLEGIRIDARYAVIYSKYDISCALEHQASSACPGYESEDAFRIAINVILYAMLQDVGAAR